MQDINNCKWIWTNNDLTLKDQMVYMRKEIIPEFEADSVILKISASGRYKLFINGKHFGTGPCPADPSLYYYDTYEISVSEIPMPDKGICIGAVCYNLGESTRVITGQNKGVPGFICHVDVKGKTSDFSCSISSDTSFKAIPSPAKPDDVFKIDDSRVSLWGGFKEIHDSRNDIKDWKLPGFNDSSWNNAVISEDAKKQFGSLTPRQVPFMTDYKVRPVGVVQTEPSLGKISDPENILSGKPVEVDASVPGSFPAIVLDFGREVVGYPVYKVKGMKGANVSFWYGESLDLHRYDTLITGGETDVYEPYHLRAFRYLKIVFNNSVDPFVLEDVFIRMYHYPYDYSLSGFSSSDSLLNRIWETSRYTVTMNTLEHFVDCPLREQAQWLADSRVMAMATHWMFRSPDIVRKAISQFLAVQSENGLIPATGPMDSPLKNMDFPCHFVTMAYEYYQYTGDREFLKQICDKLEGIINYFRSCSDDEGFIRDKDSIGFFLDWANIDRRGQVTALQCLFYQALTSFASILEVTGNNHKAKEVFQEAKVLRDKINELLFDSVKGLYYDCKADNIPSEHFSQQSTAYALITGVAPEEKAGDLIEKMLGTEGIERIKGAFLLSFVTDMLFRNGYPEKSLDIIRDYWGEMLKRGATTWWETFDRKSPFTTIPYCFAGNSPTYLIDYIPSSHCHAWGSGPAYTLLNHILGVVPEDICFDKIRVSPAKSDLDWCEGKIPTRHGIIHIKWVKDSFGNPEYEIFDIPESIEVID